MDENILRDLLAANLSVIDPTLQLIRMEYPLPNSMGSKGFVDILAKDIYNNYVIIEIKRSKTSSRETLQQIYKYIGLIKQNYHARDSQMRAIIVSTDWEELFVPFMEFTRRNTFSLIGYNVFLNENNRTIRLEKVNTNQQPENRRQLCKRYLIAFFTTQEKRDAYIDTLADKSIHLGIEDFLIVSMHATSMHNKFHEFAICFTFNKLTKDDYQRILAYKKIAHAEENEFDDTEDYIDDSEQTLLCELPGSPHCDFKEVVGPNSLEVMLLAENWEFSKIARYGFFKTDPRMTDDILLIMELKGLDGNSPGRYINYGSSIQPDRMLEVIQNCVKPFETREEWAQGLIQVLKWIQAISTSYEFLLNVFCPPSVFKNIWHSIKNQSNLVYLPSFRIFVFLENDTQLIFDGRLMWTCKPASYAGFVEFTGDNKRTSANKAIDMLLSGNYDNQVLSLLNLEWVTGMKIMNDQTVMSEHLIYFDSNNNIRKNNTPYLNFDKWTAHHTQIARYITYLFDSHISNI
ncbi:endonuclease NucS domain-containing protein [Chitinophaga sp. sic0106]|uniref:endonuclease NucS domain-containing protein n=1 Tax=Chitinophaga sp. sic0106 TaxID=2854785 RepID=UPI001C48959E|nr:endonuclease NucS domain-containing protein [Chitinophaga sp. sic0106]MBV7533783.1 DUF91 domain-containing protein [Chitinophaga sp. sic0106]